MEKRLIIPGIVLAAGLLIIISLFLVRSGNNNVVNPVKVIPQDAAFILKINGLGFPRELSAEQSEVWRELSSIPAISGINAEIKFADSLLKKYPRLYDFNRNSDIYISGHLPGGNKMTFLSIIPLSGKSKEHAILSILEEIAKQQEINFSKRKFESKLICTLKLSDEKNLHFAVYNGLLLYSSSPELLEDALHQSGTAVSLSDNQAFKQVYAAIGKNKDANLFIDFKQIGRCFSLFASNEIISNARKYKSFGDWAELDINVTDDLIMLNGFTLKGDTVASFINSICNGNPVQIEAPKVLPSSVSSFFAFGIHDAELTYRKYLEYLRETEKFDTYIANLSNMKEKYGIDFDELFLSLVADEIVLAFSNKSQENIESQYILLKCKSGTEAEKTLENLTRKLENKTNLPSNSLKINYSPDNSEKHTIYKIQVYPLFGRLLGNLFNVFDENYLTVLDNYIVAAGSRNDAAQFIDDFMLHKTLSNDGTYRNFATNLSTKSYFLCYTNLFKSAGFYKKYISDELESDWINFNPAFEKAQTLGFQISEVSNLPYLSLFLQQQKDFRGQPHTVWESLLDTTISFKPKFVLNHYTKENEIFVQDDKNNIYLLNQAGRIQWKVPLSETINSEVFQIDYFNNGKLQLMFSTENYIYIIDRNGNFTDRYPVRLRAKSTAGMALFDYDGDKNYRILIPCDDKKVYAYSKDGSIVSGWNFAGSDHSVLQPVNHFRIADKDYIVFGDNTYTYILDRKGEERVKPSELILKSANNTYYLSDNTNPENAYLVTTDTSGDVCKIYFNGKIEKQEIKRLSSHHFFDFKDVNADGISDYIFLDNNTLYVYQNNGKLIFEKKFDCTIAQHPVYYNFSYNDRKIGLVSGAKSMIYLLNNNGELYKGFPLEGSTLFSIGYFDPSTSRFNLIVGGRNNFLYNYAVE